MRPTDLFIRRPVLAVVVSCAILILGAQSASELAVREFPELEKSVIYVRTIYPGASARTVQGFVTEPLQRRIASARGVEYMTSESHPGSSTIEVHVKLGANASDVLAEIISKANEARFELPRAIEDPVISTLTGGDAMMYMAFTSEQMERARIADYLVKNVQPELVTLEGVGKADVYSTPLAMRVWLNPTRMTAHGVTALDVRDAIRRGNYVSAPGATRGEYVRASVDAQTDIRAPEQFAGIVVRQRAGRRVLLGDVAEVEMAAENFGLTSFSSGRECVFIAISEAPGANPLEVAARVKALLPKLERELPADLSLSMDYDGSVKIEDALWEVLKTLLEAAAIVVLVIYLFLGSARVVCIPMVTIPLSLVGVLFLIYALGFSLNLLTLLAMVIAIGLVVDDAIVVVENVHRHIEEGKPPMRAALAGARQVALPVVAMTLTLAAVYAPIGFLGGLTGVLFSEFALTLAGAVLVSGLVALTLSPMMCSRILRERGRQGRLADWLDARFAALRAGYRGALRRCLDNRGAVLAFALAILASLPALFLFVQSELSPEEDTGDLFVVGTPPAHGNLEYTNYFYRQMVDAWRRFPEISHGWQVNEEGSAFGGLAFHPWDERERSQQEVQLELQRHFDRISGLEIFSFAIPTLPGSDAGLPVSFVIASTADYREVDEVAERVLAAARESGLFAFVNKDLRFARPELTVAIDRDRAARLGVSMEDIGDTLQIMLGEAEVNRFNLEGRSYKVIPQAGRGFRLSKEWLERYHARGESGALLPMSTLIRLEQKVEPNVLRQYQQLNSATIQALMMPPNTVGTGLAFLERKMRELAPPDFRAGHTGQSRRHVQESGGFPLLFFASLALIYLVLAALFNGFRNPFVVLVGVPLSVFGAVVPISLGATTFNIYTQVGLLTLVGLISKHGILIVDFANHLVGEGREPRQAVLEAAALRLRPILMTTFATVLGVLPLVLAEGAGANSRFAIGMTITAGMLVGTLFTLFVLPAFYPPFRRPRLPAPAAGEPPAWPRRAGAAR